MWLRTKNGYDFQVDEEDYALASEPGWHGYISRQRRTNGEWRRYRKYISRHVYKNGKRTTECLHRLILNISDNIECDHKNGDGLDNRRNNIRICTKAQNMRNQGKPINNTSGYKGVHFHKPRCKWLAAICINGKYKHIGLFLSKEQAALAYNKAALEYFGEFARLNEIK